MAQAPETKYPEAEQISFELERLTLTDQHRLELAGRWFGVRGRRFVRPTLTLIGADKRSRSLADLEHKPWAPEDGTSWLAVFQVQDPDEDVLKLELAVAPDIAVMLSPPPELAQLHREPGPSSRAVMSPRTPPRPLREVPLAESAAEPVKAEPKPKPTARRGATARAQDTIERQRREIQGLEEDLASAAGSEVELRSALGRRDAAVEKLEAVLEQQQAQERERALADEDREGAERERSVALRERDEARRGWMQARAGWTDAVRERTQLGHERDQALIQRDQALIERDQAVIERDQAVSERERVASELERVLTERDRAPTERDRAMAERDRVRADGAVPPVPRPVMAPPTERGLQAPELRRARRSVVWATRLFALLVLLAAIAAIAIIVHSA